MLESFMSLPLLCDLLWLRGLPDVRNGSRSPALCPVTCWIMTPVSAFVISFCCVSKCNSSKKKKHKILDKNATPLGWFELIVLKAWSLCVSLSGIFTVTCSGCVWSRPESVICAVLGLWLLYLNPWNCKIKRNVLTGCGQRVVSAAFLALGILRVCEGEIFLML